MFPSQRSLLNPKFDGYKLQSLKTETSLASVPLPAPGITQSTVSNRNASLSFEDVQSRIKQNHLSRSRFQKNMAAYIDQDGTLTIVDVSEEVRFHQVFTCPQPISTSSATSDRDHPAEYPVAVEVGNNIWLISDGRGWLYVVRVETSEEGTFTGSLMASFVNEDPSGPSRSIPLLLHIAKLDNPQTLTAVWSQHAVSEHSSTPESSGMKSGSRHKPGFDVICAQVNLDGLPNDSVGTINIKWKRHGDSIPGEAWFDDTHRAVVLMAGSGFQEEDEMAKKEPSPSPDEIAPVPRIGETLDVQPPSALPPPPYSWTQTSDSVTVAFPLPSTTPSSAIKVTITAGHLSLLVHHSTDPGSASFPLPRYLRKEFWDNVDASASFWTWDREGERSANGGSTSVGLLSLHLEKKHDGTKWPHVFRTTGTDSTAPEDVEVPETIDPSELWKIRESLEKYTAALNEGDDASGLGLGKGLPSLAQGEIDDEVDSTAGTSVKLTWVQYDGQQWKDEATTWPPSATLLSKPLLTAGGFKPSLVIKQDIDGLLFEPHPESRDPSISPYSDQWVHTATYPALAFVLASKRDLKFAYHFDSRVVMAFESGRADIGGNVYFYYGANGNRSARQSVLKIGGGTAGALLGVCGVEGQDGKLLVLCLCESQLFVISKLLVD